MHVAARCLQAAQADMLAWSMIGRNLHVQSRTAVAKVLGRENSAFLADEKGGLHI